MERPQGTADNLGADGFLRVEEAGEFLRLGKSKVYELMASGQLPSVKIHGARRIPKRALLRFAEQLVAAAR